MTSPLPGQRMLHVHALDSPVVAIATRASGRRGVELAAVRFDGGVPGATFTALSSTLVDFKTFADDAPVVGFDLAAALSELAQAGAAPAGSPWDVAELAGYVAPDAQAPTPAGMGRVLLGANSPSLAGDRGPMGAAEEAELVGWLYLALIERARSWPSAILLRLATFVGQAQSPLRELLDAVADDPSVSPGGPMLGLDTREVEERLGRQRPIGAPTAARGVDAGEVENLLGPDGLFARRFPRYEPRPEQLVMARAVASTLASPTTGVPRHLLVEGGTGIGKSVAYLLPAVLFALRNNVRVVVSTSTINLQEQLVSKDIPDVLATLDEVSGLDVSRFRYTQMKGKANYLCLRRWEAQATVGALSAEEARLMAKTLVWLQKSRTGDRSEIRLESGEGPAWERLSASGFAGCAGAREGACFYRHARDEAAGAHLIVVNHALLLSDLLVDGSLLPDYEFLIVDEAHNLEAEATRQFGFRVSQATVDDLLVGASVTFQGLAASIRASDLDDARKDAMRSRIDESQLPLVRVRDAWSDLAAGLTGFANIQRTDGASGGELSVNAAMRSSPDWSDLEIAWDNFERSLGETAERVGALLRSLDSVSSESLPGLDARKGELTEWLTNQQEVRNWVAGFVSSPDLEMVYWLGDLTEALSLNGAPLAVAGQLDAGLFSKKQAVVLTSATLSVAGDFTHLRQRLGLERMEGDANDAQGGLALGSPFDYERGVLLCLPTDAPEPRDPRYVDIVADALHDLAVEAGGRTMALFTSHASLRATATALRRRLRSRGIAVLAQGLDGTPQQLVARFQQQPKAVLLGTSSFWEGVDIGNESLKVLVLARLPFNVPTDPVFAARSALYEQPFMQYAVPQAVLRFRQGFGRLIRSKGDKGAVIVLDGRMTTKAYGSWFMRSLPQTTTLRGPLAQTVAAVGEWLGTPEGA